MKITSLWLRDFANIEAAEFEFTSAPLVLIAGDNGSGKSSILKALALALADTKDGTLEDYIRWGTKGFSITVRFTHLEIEYTLSVTCIKAGKSVTTHRELNWWDLKEDRHELRNSDVTQFLEELIQSSQCQYTVFSSQGNLDLVFATPANRRALLQRIYDLDFSVELERAGEEIQLIDEKIRETDSAVSEAQGKLSMLVEQPLLPVPARLPPVIEADLARIRALEKDLIGKQSKVEALESHYGGLQVEIAGFIKKRDALFGRLAPLRESALRVEDTIQARTMEVEGAKKALLAGIKVAPRIPIVNAEERDQQISEYEKAVQQGEFAVKAAEQKVVACQGVCPTCNRPWEANLDQLSSAKVELDQARCYVASNQELLTPLKAARDQYVELKKQALEVQTSNARIQQQVSEAEVKLRQEIDALNQGIAELPVLEQELQGYNEHLEALEQRVPVLLQEIMGLRESFGGIALTTLQKDIKLLETEYEETVKVLALNDETRRHNQGISVHRAALNRQLESLAETRLADERERSEWAAVKTLLQSQLPSFVLVRLLKVLETNANRFLGRAYQGRYQVQLEETARGGIELQYGTDGVWKEASLASGAEKSLINLSLKLGFTQLSGLSILILDEVDAYFSDDVATAVFDLLVEEAQAKSLSQIFVISHKEGLKEQLGNYGAQVYTMDDGEVV